MEKFLHNTKKFIFLQQKDILSSAIVLALMIVVSRLFGFLRYRTLATFFSKEELDIFLSSFRLPDFIFEVLITGALTSAFIPIFIKYKKSREELSKNISSIVNFMIGGLVLFIIVSFFLSPLIIPLLTPGFNDEKIKLIVNLSRILLIFQLPFLVLGNILSGMAQAHKIFIVTAIAPILYNLGIIVGTVIFTHSFWIYGPIIGVVIGALLFFIVQVPTLFAINFQFRFFIIQKNALVEFVRLFVPRVLSVMTTQVDLTIDLILATFLGSGSYTIFFFAQHLQLFPVSFIGMSFGQASLPYLSDLYKENKLVEIKKIFVDSLLHILFLTVPISFFFIFARTPIVRFFFGGVKFDWEGTVQTAITLSYFAISLPFHAIFYFITRSFYALHDTKTPFIINVFSVGINSFLSVLFIFVLKLPVWSLANSFSIAIICNVLLLLFFFYKKIGSFERMRLMSHAIKIYIASFFSSSCAYPLMKFFDGLIFDTTRTINVFFLITVTFFIFALVYLFLSWLLNIEEIYLLGRLSLKMREMKKKIVEMYSDIG
ncbi:MAG TPA: murein biosynthesis integral membrane protein MurJ [Patescibacteria group bacterium]|nr:murein biosynthesis integral membrane protein MurJ [Patescibacteria group bacterium]